MPALNNFFGLCIDELEELVTKFVQEECIQDIVIGNVGIMHLDVVIAMVAIKQVCKTNIDKRQSGRRLLANHTKTQGFTAEASSKNFVSYSFFLYVLLQSILIVLLFCLHLLPEI